MLGTQLSRAVFLVVLGFLMTLGLAAPASAAVPQWKVSTVQGQKLKVPVGWQVINPKAGVIVLSDPATPTGPFGGEGFGMFLVWRADPSGLSAAQLSERLIEDITGKTVFNLIGESSAQGVLSRLYLGAEGKQQYTVSTASYAGDRAAGRGQWVTAFLEPEARFNDLGGAMFPFAVLGKVSDAELSAGIAKSKKEAVVMQTAPPKASAANPDPRCQPLKPTGDAFEDAKTAIGQIGCEPDPILAAFGASLKAQQDEAFNNYAESLRRSNVAWDNYMATLKEYCSGKNAKTVAELQAVQSTCQVSMQAASNSLNTWHQTNQGILFNSGNQPWCYAYLRGNCR
ncbi:hypothetical protein [Deinococcus frigens]|uniref:hypothetical protein n=1 Tax=Deinococcus frigens TaxID=249403 RepID=UPI0004985E4B|nr:hypothetical protein [Deinococcus frigens]